MWGGSVHADGAPDGEELAATAQTAAAEAIAEEALADQELAPPAIGELELKMLALVNGARIGRGIAPLAWDQTIAEMARVHATDMMRRGVVSHTGSDGSTPVQRMRRAGVKFQYGSENIWTYWGKVPSEGPSTMHAAMMAEPYAPGLWNHIGNILYSGYKRIGIAIVVSPSGVQYLCEKFAD
jgi:uncharacterized protein YkwD